MNLPLVSDLAFERYEAVYEAELHREKDRPMWGSEHEQLARRKMIEAVIAECSSAKAIVPEALPRVMRAFAAGRCYSCGWPLMSRASCKPFDCSMRFSEGTEHIAERENWRARAKEMADVLAWATNAAPQGKGAEASSLDLSRKDTSAKVADTAPAAAAARALWGSA